MTTTWPTEPAAALDALREQMQGDALTLATVERILAASGSSAHGTARDWMRAHDGMLIDTVQVGLGRRSAWAPQARRVDASHATFVRLDGSRRDYAGLRVLAATADGLTVADDSHVVAYAVSVAQ